MARPEVTGKKFIAKRAVATRYGITIRTVDRWVRAGHLPAPDLVINHHGYWAELELDQHDRRAVGARAAAAESPSTKSTEQPSSI